MAIHGETLANGASPICTCGKTVKVGVLQSGAGWYIGSFCPGCGPYSRESGYYPDRASAEAAMVALTNY